MKSVLAAETWYAVGTVTAVLASLPALVNRLLAYWRLRKSGRNGALRIIARGGVREAAVLLILQADMLWVLGHGVYAREWMLYPDAAQFRGVLLRRMAVPCFVAYLSLMEWNDRRRSHGLLPAK